MTISITAANCPAPMHRAAFLSLAGASPVAKQWPAGSSLGTMTAFNRNASQLDLTGAYGGGLYAVAFGLGLTAGIGLSLTVAQGHALIDGVVELLAATAIGLGDNHTGVANNRVWLWLLQNGTVAQTANTLVPPSTACCLLGSATTSAGVITGVDTSGVLYLRGGLPLRSSGDAGLPTDTPAYGLAFFHQSVSGLYLWTGAAYALLDLPNGSVTPPKLAHATRAIVASGNAVATDEALFVDASAGAVTVTLPTANGSVLGYLTVKKTDASANVVTITAAGGQTIDGAASVTIGAQYGVKRLRAGGAALPTLWSSE